MKKKWRRASIAMLVVPILLVAGFFVAWRALLHSKFGDMALAATGNMSGLADNQTREARVELAQAKSDPDRCMPLTQIAKNDVRRGNIVEARAFADELLAIAAKIKSNSNRAIHFDYGMAVHDGNLVLGRIAVRDHRIEDAKRYLLRAGMTPGAATLDSFGPNMALAQDLLTAGQRGAVIQYFDECRHFWKSSHSPLDSWETEVKAGGTPNFGANLYY